MTTAPPPPPTLPPSGGNQLRRTSPPPVPRHAAIPFCNTPVQETSPAPETQHVEEGASAPAELPEQNGPQFPSDKEGKSIPVRGSDPAQQQQDKEAFQTDPDGEDQN